jgi:diguanylate cyclase (GGDEF)-like protein
VLRTKTRLVSSKSLLLLIVLVGVACAVAIVALEQRADASRREQTKVGSVEFAVAFLENAAFDSDPHAGGSASYARASIASANASINQGLGHLMADGSPPGPILHVAALVKGMQQPVQDIYRLGVAPGGYASSNHLLLNREQAALGAATSSALGLLSRGALMYSRRAERYKSEALVGSLATILLLLLVFVYFYRRATSARVLAERLSAENARLLAASRDDAVTDPLTGLGNRRAFKHDLEQILPQVSGEHELLVAMFDLDGFKEYNDTFGHAAGDALLARLSRSLKEIRARPATAYRLGGDEFCLLAQVSAEHGQQLVIEAVEALTDHGDGWRVGCSWGVAWLPSDAAGSSEALRLADERMYAQKASRVSASHQTTAALVQVLAERDAELSAHTNHVAELSIATAHALGVAEPEIDRIGLAAQLHDIGKTGIPESILMKPGPLDEDEWAFMRRHTLIGERIIAAAPSLAHTASLVRSSHERPDGAGYPSGLVDSEIPLGSKIIAVCDAYDAMIAPRPYRQPVSTAEAVAELRRCAGTQFDPAVVEAFCAHALTLDVASVTAAR